QEPTSLEAPVGDEEDSHLGDFIQDTTQPTPYDAATRQLLKEHMEEVGREFAVTRERIRQIEAKALRKLRHPSRSKKLKDYLE
ncbi:hypothetical protein HZB97_03010, partial [Candidatus Gottesmanbacteria bacterium]|nr:hypothetical protein [Candidatus Gottesmanbacteria bacterium]